MAKQFGRYEILGPLGRGGMAEVSLARYVGPEGFEKRLVLKRLRPELVRDRRLLQLFFEEARTHVGLSHGNLVPVFDFGRVGNTHFIAMEHIVGEDLLSLLERMQETGQRLPTSVVAYIGLEVARGLAYVHRRRLVHRDVAPRNVLVSTEGEVKLSDFGIALGVDDAATASICGTLAYLAPEAARGEAIDGRADVYSLGLVLAEAVRGERVRPSAEPDAALAAARVATVVEVEGPLADVLRRATEPSLAARLGSAEELQLALEKIVQAQGGVAAAARQLAAIVVPASEEVTPARAAVTPTAATLDAGLGAEAGAAADVHRQATYYQGRVSDETFVNELLAAPPAPSPTLLPRARRGLWLGGGAALLLALALGSGALVRRVATGPTGATTSSETIEPTSASSSSSSRLEASSAGPTAGGIAAHAEGTAPSSLAANRETHAAGKSELFVRCTPWCDLLVDNKARSTDRRTHQVTLSAGRHLVAVQRLDDRQERSIVIRAGEPLTVDFSFQ